MKDYKIKLGEKEWKLEPKLGKKFDKMVERLKKKDVVLLIEGSEGEGKSNASEVVAQYIRQETGRTINMFFRLKPMMEFAKSTSDQLIIWDEPALDSLSTDWYKSKSKDLIRLLMTCRKKRHMFIFNFVKFYKFSEYIVVDRSHGMLHIYTRGDGQQGRWVYIKQKNLEPLWNLYKQKKIRGYGKYKNFGGWFPLIENYFDYLDMTIEGKPHCTLQDYEDIKDKAIESIGESGKPKEHKWHIQRNALLHYILKEYGVSQKELGKVMKERYGIDFSQQAISYAIQGTT